MKFYSVLILFLLIAYINSICQGTTPSGKKDCKDKLSDEEKKTNSYCCYAENKNGDKTCLPLKKDEYNDIKNYIKEANNNIENDKEKIKSLNCNSLFLKLGLMNILLFLL